jgi:hypothetical protein
MQEAKRSLIPRDITFNSAKKQGNYTVSLLPVCLMISTSTTLSAEPIPPHFPQTAALLQYIP